MPELIDYVRALENRNSHARGEQVLSILITTGLEPTIQACRWPRVRNIIVDFMPGSTVKRPIFSAHYDVIKGSPGANDNASGVAVLLGLCESLKNNPQPVRIVFFDREEAWCRTPFLRLGLLGSLYYICKKGVNDVSFMYNLEFCGQGDYLGIWPVKNKETQLAVVQQIEMAALKLGIPFQNIHIPWTLLSSDHLSFRLWGFANSVSLSLIPSDQVQELEEMVAKLRLTRILMGQRPPLPAVLQYIHTRDDNSSRISEDSLKLMLSLLCELSSNVIIPGDKVHSDLTADK